MRRTYRGPAGGFRKGDKFPTEMKSILTDFKCDGNNIKYIQRIEIIFALGESDEAMKKKEEKLKMEGSAAT